MNKIFQILLAAILMTAMSFVAAASGEGYIEAEGVVYPEGQSLNAARRIAILDAYRYLAEEVDNLQVSVSSTVKNLRELDDNINTKVETALRGAKVVSVNRESDGSFHAIVRMPIYGSSQSLASAVLDEKVQVEDFPPPKIVNIVSVNHTGLIIDCRGKNLSEAIAPTIKTNDGKEVYAYKNLGYQTTVNRGMIAYSQSLDTGVERAGGSPLVIKAVSVSGGCDIIVSSEDADKILNANQSAHFLNNCAVVLVR